MRYRYFFNETMRSPRSLYCSTVSISIALPHQPVMNLACSSCVELLRSIDPLETPFLSKTDMVPVPFADLARMWLPRPEQRYSSKTTGAITFPVSASISPTLPFFITLNTAPLRVRPTSSYLFPSAITLPVEELNMYFMPPLQYAYTPSDIETLVTKTIESCTAGMIILPSFDLMSSLS